jgi:hypothetical protein
MFELRDEVDEPAEDEEAEDEEEEEDRGEVEMTKSSFPTRDKKIEIYLKKTQITSKHFRFKK